MNKQKFIEFLKNPQELNEHNLEELDELVIEYPYFQAGRVLEAKANRSLKTQVAGRKTASAAIYSTNRILFKKYLKEGGEIATSSTVETKPVTVAPPAQAIETTTEKEVVIPEKVETLETVETDDTQGSSKIDLLIYSLQQDMKELEKSRARYIEVTRKIEEEEAVEKAVKKATGSVKAAAKTTKSTDTTSTRTATKKTPASKTKTTTPKASTTKSNTAKTTTTKASTTKKTATSKSPAKSTSTRTRASSTKKTSTTKKATTKSPAKKTTTKSTTRKSTTRAPRTTKATKSAKKDEGEGENQRELIDQFIKTNPSFKPDRDSKNKEDLSLESTILPEDLVSEHLAEIFIGQGKKDKAIKIYNSLMLRFPEKKTYFAGRIKEIE